MARDMSESNLNEFGRFDALKEPIDKRHSRASFEDVFVLRLSPIKANIKAADLLKRFVLAGGFNVADYQAE